MLQVASREHSTAISIAPLLPISVGRVYLCLRTYTVHMEKVLFYLFCEMASRRRACRQTDRQTDGQISTVRCSTMWHEELLLTPHSTYGTLFTHAYKYIHTYLYVYLLLCVQCLYDAADSSVQASCHEGAFPR